MKRAIDFQLLAWSKEKNFKPLLLRGARQVGKTHAVRELGKTFDHFIEINLEKNESFQNIFDADLSTERMISDIQYRIKKPIIPGKTLLFFDEVQVVPRAIIALRYFFETIPNLHVIAAGSLLDFAIEQVGVPVGRVQFLYMYPMSLLEFLNALDEKMLLDAIANQKAHTPMNSFAHEHLIQRIKEYLAIGGMPEVVKCWVEEKNAFKCLSLQQSLIDAYRQDFNKYAKKSQLKYLELLFNSIPLQLGKKFKFSAIPGEFRKRELSPCLDLLETAGIVRRVYSTAAQGIPLGAQIDLDEFKVIFLDVALAQAVLGLDITQWLISTEDPLVNKGEIIEAFIGQEILAYSNPFQKQQLYYWLREARGAQAEVDYVIALQQKIIPIEVKSGAGSTLKSMHIFLESHAQSPFGIRFSTQNYSVYEKIYSYPLYAVSIATQTALEQHI